MFARSDSRLRRRVLGRYRYVRTRWRVLFAIIDALGHWAVVAARLSRCGFTAAPLDGKVSGTGPNETVRRILLVQCDHLGDALITTAMLAPLRREYTAATIEVLAAPWNSQVFEASPEIDRVHVWHLNRFNREHRFAWVWAVFWWGLALRRRRFDLQSTSVENSRTPSCCAFWRPAKTRLGCRRRRVPLDRQPGIRAQSPRS